MKRVLVTGAGGFIGGALLPVLARRGFTIHGVTRSAKPSQTGVTWHQADLLTEKGRERVLAASRPSHFVHLAWEARPGRYRDDPLNIQWAAATADLLDRARASGTARILGIGSCLEYGPFSGPCEEDTSACRPTTLYGQAKLGAARHFLAAAAAGVAWGRVFFTFGPDEPAARLIPSLIRSLLVREIFRCSHGAQLRDFIYIEDLAQAIAAVLDSGLTGAVNLASGEPRSLRSVVEHVAFRLGARDLVNFGAVDATGVEAEPVIAADVRRLNSVIADVPVLGFAEGVERDIAWWSRRPSGPA